ncbi:mitochondrial 37S ribosomal protein rsm10 [Coemansia sp. RSA 2675]|nr:mitochondrial 37S ribosomal protein rsm10 [Coemansia sp. RSA 2675]KAJ2413541.1 mitochondrial 37S ribosomal protein rsm10 [Coemansia sp. RSA 2530]KAJ2693221.1 mitochondrial 37S ribosomal protein rsm10 [Coemansia sp. IMI 209128]
MLRSIASRVGHVARPALSVSQPLMAAAVVAGGLRHAATYAKILDKVLGIDIRKKEQHMSPKDTDPIYENPVILPAPHGVQVCSVTFKSFQLHRLDFYMTFCRKAAASMQIPCTGTVCLPTVLRRWTVLKSPFVHKSAMEVFERRTHKRLLVIRDTDPEVLQKWLKYVNDNIPPGIGMRYKLTEYEPLDIGTQIDQAITTGNPGTIDPESLTSSNYLQNVVKRGRRRLWTTFKQLPVYSRSEIEKMASDVVAQLKESPRSGIEAITREVVDATKPPPEPKKPKTKKPVATRKPPAKRAGSQSKPTNAKRAGSQPKPAN